VGQDTIGLDQSLITVESDKASMEIPASHAGVVKELKVKLGDKVKEGSVLLTLQVPTLKVQHKIRLLRI
jgi:pyruvate/2-oxoglutarate dehydrogenase complex dihydrolipoamide acyltransferase (E2) component